MIAAVALPGHRSGTAPVMLRKAGIFDERTHQPAFNITMVFDPLLGWCRVARFDGPVSEISPVLPALSGGGTRLSRLTMSPCNVG
jgi:hypothetical protein